MKTKIIYYLEATERNEIIKAMNEKLMSIRDLAKALGISHPYLYNILQGVRCVTKERYDQINEAIASFETPKNRKRKTQLKQH